MLQEPRDDERREFQRLAVSPPIDGRFGDDPVKVTELGVLGARLHHAAPLTQPQATLRFTFDGKLIVMRCKVVRTLDGGSSSGLRFLAALEDSGDHFRLVLGMLVQRALEELHDSSATRLRLRATDDGDKTVRGTDAQFLAYRLESGGWRKRHVFLPEQSPSGFTVARGEDGDEMQRLCSVYEASDEEGRRLIRMFAELSVSHALQIPPSS